MFKGKILQNSNKEEVENVFPEGLKYTTCIEYEPNTTFIGPKSENGHFRGSQKSMDLLTKLLTIFISPSQTTFEANIYICDPFMGTGSTGEVAHNFFCHFIGNDRDKVAVEVTSRRLAPLSVQ